MIRTKYIRFSTLTVAVVVLATAQVARAAKSDGHVIDRIVAVINDDIIFDSELGQWAAIQLQQPPNLTTSDGKKQWHEHKRKVLDQMIDGRLMSQQATELKLSVTADEIDRAIEQLKTQNNLDGATFVEALHAQGFTLESYRKNMKRQLLELKVMNTAVRSRVSISDDDVKAAYDQNVRQMTQEKSAHIRQVFLQVVAGAAPDEIERKKRAAVRVMELEREGRPFEELAKLYSDDAATKGDGGDLGWVTAGTLDEIIEQVIVTMDVNETRGPIRTERGFHVLKLIERKAADVKTYEESKEALRRTLYDQQVERATQSWLKELRKKSHVDVRM